MNRFLIKKFDIYYKYIQVPERAKILRFIYKSFTWIEMNSMPVYITTFYTLYNDHFEKWIINLGDNIGKDDTKTNSGLFCFIL